MKIESSQINQFAVCLNNEGYEASLEVGKIYRVIPNETAEINGLIRVIDERVEDYAFSVNRFHAIELPKPIEEALLSVAN
jgi:predicted pyridoxine 5'-phosphate oxidase superfamily flavin-nucleotide-binding protein